MWPLQGQGAELLTQPPGNSHPSHASRARAGPPSGPQPQRHSCQGCPGQLRAPRASGHPGGRPKGAGWGGDREQLSGRGVGNPAPQKKKVKLPGSIPELRSRSQPPCPSPSSRTSQKRASSSSLTCAALPCRSPKPGHTHEVPSCSAHPAQPQGASRLSAPLSPLCKCCPPPASRSKPKLSALQMRSLLPRALKSFHLRPPPLSLTWLGAAPAGPASAGVGAAMAKMGEEAQSKNIPSSRYVYKLLYCVGGSRSC